MNQKLINTVKGIINTNIYLTLGTTGGGIPWTAPIFYAVDNNFTFYFISQLDSMHIQHILKNPSVAFSIFDSHQKEGTGIGVQGSGRAHRLSDEELSEAFKWYKTTFIKMVPESFMSPAPYRFFKIIPDHFYTQDPDATVDRRIEVDLLTES